MFMKIVRLIAISTIVFTFSTQYISAQSVKDSIQKKHITQVIFGRSATRGWKRYFYLSAIHQFLRDAPAVDVHIVTQPERDDDDAR